MTIGCKVGMFLGVAVLVGSGAVARAESIQIFSVPVTSPAGGGNTNFAYQVFVSANNEVRAGDFFTLVDFTRFVAVASVPAGWTLYNAAGLATTPAGAAGSSGPFTLIATQAGAISVFDSVGTPDLTFEYFGATVGGAASNTLLGTFVITSSAGQFNLAGSTIVGSDHQTGTGIAGQNGDPYFNPGFVDLFATPLPAASWGVVGLLGMVGVGRVILRGKMRNTKM